MSATRPRTVVGMADCDQRVRDCYRLLKLASTPADHEHLWARIDYWLDRRNELSKAAP